VKKAADISKTPSTFPQRGSAVHK